MELAVSTKLKENYSCASLQTTELDNRTMTPAGIAYGTVRAWLDGAEMNMCDEDEEPTWTCQFTRDKKSFRLVWNVTRPTVIHIQPSWEARHFTPLLSGAQPLIEPSVRVGPVPELVWGEVP
jgi:hypothetical protein